MTDTSSTTTAFTVSPDEAAQALRLGWMMAEVRGRLDPNTAYEPPAEIAPPTLVLEAAGERSAVEGQIQATKILSSLGSLDLTKIDITTLSRASLWRPDPAADPAFTTTDMLRHLVCGLIFASDPKGVSDVHNTLSTRELTAAERAVARDVWWDRLRWFLWAWDEALQDELSADKFGTASAYQLGRGLSESYWALNRRSTDADAKWAFLLGDDRVPALCDLARRLAPVFSTYTAPAIEASLTKWQEVAKNPAGYEHPTRTLYAQVQIWRDLLVTGRDPLTLVKPEKLEAVARDPRPVLRAFRWELLTALVLAAALALSLTYFESEARSALAALAAVGISASAIVSWIKSRAQSVASRIGSAVDQSVVNDAVTRTPAPLRGAAPAPGSDGETTAA